MKNKTEDQGPQSELRGGHVCKGQGPVFQGNLAKVIKDHVLMSVSS
jgi:hypothetical protein